MSINELIKPGEDVDRSGCPDEPSCCGECSGMAWEVILRDMARAVSWMTTGLIHTWQPSSGSEKNKTSAGCGNWLKSMAATRQLLRTSLTHMQPRAHTHPYPNTEPDCRVQQRGN